MHPNDNFNKPYEKVRVSFEGGSYSFSKARNAGLIRIRVLFEGESLSRIYGRCFNAENLGFLGQRAAKCPAINL